MILYNFICQKLHHLNGQRLSTTADISIVRHLTATEKLNSYLLQRTGYEICRCYLL